MRTTEEIQAQIDETINDDTDGSSYSRCAREGALAGFRAGLKMVKEGKTESEIALYAQSDERAYRSWGDDCRDIEQSAYTSALYWCAHQYDWDSEGRPIFRPGNIFGYAASGT